MFVMYFAHFSTHFRVNSQQQNWRCNIYEFYLCQNIVADNYYTNFHFILSYYECNLDIYLIIEKGYLITVCIRFIKLPLTKYQKLSILKPLGWLIISQFCGIEVYVPARLSFSEIYKRELFFVPFSFFLVVGNLQLFQGLQPCHFNLFLCGHMAFFLCISVSRFPFSKDTSQTELGLTLMTSGYLITFAKNLFPNKVTIIGLGVWTSTQFSGKCSSTH